MEGIHELVKMHDNFDKIFFDSRLNLNAGRDVEERLLEGSEFHAAMVLGKEWYVEL